MCLKQKNILLIRHKYPSIFIFILLIAINAFNAPLKAATSYEIPDKIMVSILNSIKLNDNEILLRLSSEKTYSGCVNISPLGYTMEIKDGTVFIETDGYAVEDTSGKDCDANYKIPTANIVLNLKDMKKDAIKLIRLSNGNNEDVFAIRQTDEFIELIQQNDPLYFHDAGWKDGIQQTKLYLKPNNAVILFVRNPPHTDIKPYMDQFAREHKLSLEKTGYIYPSPKSGKSEFLYIDPKSVYIPTTKKFPYLKIGKITIHNKRSEQFRKWPERINLDVYVKKP